jgi:hypothetical protein
MPILCEKCSSSIVQDSPYRSMEVKLPKKNRRSLLRFNKINWNLIISIIASPILVGSSSLAIVYLPCHLGRFYQHRFNLTGIESFSGYWWLGIFYSSIAAIIIIVVSWIMFRVGELIYIKLNK